MKIFYRIGPYYDTIIIKVFGPKNTFTLGLVANRLYRQIGSCVTRLGDLLDFGQIFKAFGND